MHALARLLSAGNICLDLDAGSKDALLEQAARLLQQRQGLESSRVLSSLLRREAAASTALGHGAAVAHASIPGLRQPAALLLRTRCAIPFDAPDGEPVALFFVLLVPEAACEEQLELLSMAAGLFSENTFRERLRACRSVGAVLELLDDWISVY